MGYGVGHVLGRKIKKKKATQDFNKDTLYLLRLSAWVIYLKAKAKSKTPISTFLRLLETALDEFRPSLVMQLCNGDIGKELERLIKFLKSTPCHTSLLNLVLEVEFHIKHKFQLSQTAARMRCILIPVYHLMSIYYPSLEVVQKIGTLLEKESVKELLDKERSSWDMMGFQYASKMVMSENLVLSQLMIAEGYDKPYHQKAYSKVIRGRPSSLPDDSSDYQKVKLNFKQTRCCEVLKALTTVDSIREEEIEDSCNVSIASPLIERRLNPLSFSINGGMFKLNEVEMGLSPPPQIYGGFTNELIDSEDSEASEGSLKAFEPESASRIHEDEIEEVKQEEPVIKLMEIEVKVHPFMESFNQLLAIEAEPADGADWRQTVNKPDTKIYTKTPKDSPMCMVKAFCIVPYPQEVAFRAIWDTSVRRQWDAVFNEFKLIDSYEFHDTLYYMIKTPLGITKRDWVQRRTHLRDFPGPGNIIAHFVSIDHPNVPPIKNVIRATTIVSGYVFRSTGPNSCTLTIISQNDIKGLIPKMIVNRVSSKAPADWVKSLYKGCQLVEKLS